MIVYLDEKVKGEEIGQIKSKIINLYTHYNITDKFTEIEGNIHINIYGENGQFSHDFPISIVVPNDRIPDRDKFDLQINDINLEFVDHECLIKAEANLVGIIEEIEQANEEYESGELYNYDDVLGDDESK